MTKLDNKLNLIIETALPKGYKPEPYVSQIKKLIREEIEKEMPKKLRHITNTKGEKNEIKSEWDKIANAVQEEIDIKNKLIDKFESVIKNILD